MENTKNKLFGTPKTINEAADTLQEFYQDDKDLMNMVLDVSENVFALTGCGKVSAMISEAWPALHWTPENGILGWPQKRRPAIVGQFNRLGITDPFSMEMFLVRCFYRRAHGLPLDIKFLVRHFKGYEKWQAANSKQNNGTTPNF